MHHLCASFEFVGGFKLKLILSIWVHELTMSIDCLNSEFNYQLSLYLLSDCPLPLVNAVSLTMFCRD